MERRVGQPEGRVAHGRFVKTSVISGARIGLRTRNSEFCPMLSDCDTVKEHHRG